MTVPSIETGKFISRKLIENNLAACINLVPNLISVFRWHDQIHEDPECLMIIKTTADRQEELQSIIKENHPYENPEIIFVSAIDGLPAYLEWVIDETHPA